LAISGLGRLLHFFGFPGAGVLGVNIPLQGVEEISIRSLSVAVGPLNPLSESSAAEQE
jgi:hypothetical protein